MRQKHWSTRFMMLLHAFHGQGTSRVFREKFQLNILHDTWQMIGWQTSMKTRCCICWNVSLQVEDSDGIHIAETFLVTCLLEIYWRPDWDGHYATAKNNAWLRQWGQELGTGVLDKLVAIVNLDQSHWVSVVVDGSSSTCYSHWLTIVKG